MQNTVIQPLQEIEIARLLRYIRREEEQEYSAQLCADVSSEFSRIARHVAKVGFSLSDEWKSAEHLVLTVKEYKTRLAAIHIRVTGDTDNQGVDVSQTILRRRETKPVSFSLPSQFHDAKGFILAQLLDVFPEGSLIAMKTSAEIIPLFEPPTIHKPMPSNEGEIKALAIEEANQSGEDAPMIKSPYADDNLPKLNYARR